MGQRIEVMSQRSGGLVAVVARRGRACPTQSADPTPDVVVDFSSDAGTQAAIRLAIQHQCALLVGTTGLSDETRGLLRSAAGEIAILIAPNTSIGVAVMRHLVAEAVRLLSADFEISISEAHHAQKRDKPSGTASSLADSVEKACGIAISRDNIHSVRAGETIGDHEVTLTGPGETLSLRHHAQDRDLFALGAIRLARWLAGQPAGLFGVDDWFKQFKESKR